MKDEKKYIKSPLNYTGGKHKLLPQILPLFPKDIDTFVDVFGGGFNVGINVDAKKVIFNDSMPILADLFNHWKGLTIEQVLDTVYDNIFEFGLTNTAERGYAYYDCESSSGVGEVNKEGFAKLKAKYNETKDISMFYSLMVFSFNNQIRFNKKGEFNTAVNKRDFNKNIRKNLVKFLQKLETMDVEFLSEDYLAIKHPLNKDHDLWYFDPPYLGATATYNEQGGWTEDDEKKLHASLDLIDLHKAQFALSGVFKSKGYTNQMLIDWSKKYNIHFLDNNYGNSSYHKKDKSTDGTVEVLVTNY